MKRGLGFQTRQLLQAVVSSKHNVMFKMYIIRAHCDRQRYSHCLFLSICKLLEACVFSHYLFYCQYHMTNDICWAVKIYVSRVKHNNNNSNITCIRSYVSQAHGHKQYIQIHNTVINWKRTHTRTCQNNQKKHYMYRQLY